MSNVQSNEEMWSLYVIIQCTFLLKFQHSVTHRGYQYSNVVTCFDKTLFN